MHQTVHLIIGIVELIPIIGQIASLFEVALASLLSERSNSDPRSCSLSRDTEEYLSPIHECKGDDVMLQKGESEHPIETSSLINPSNRDKFKAQMKRMRAAEGGVDLRTCSESSIG